MRCLRRMRCCARSQATGPVPRVGKGFAREDRVVAQAIASTVPEAYRHCLATCVLTMDLNARYACQAPALGWADPRRVKDSTSAPCAMPAGGTP